MISAVTKDRLIIKLAEPVLYAVIRLLIEIRLKISWHRHNRTRLGANYSITVT